MVFICSILSQNIVYEVLGFSVGLFYNPTLQQSSIKYRNKVGHFTKNVTEWLYSYAKIATMNEFGSIL